VKLNLYAAVFLLLILISPAAEKISQEAAPDSQQSVSLLKLVWDIAKYPLLIVIIFAILAFIVVKLILMIIKWIKLKDNDVQKMIEMKIRLGRMQQKFKYKSHFFRWKSNSPIFLFFKDINQKITKEYFGVYMGDFLDNEGILWINFSVRPVHFLLFFVPQIETIMCPQKSKLNINTLKDVMTQTYDTKEVDIAKINVHFLDSEILIETNSIDKVSDEFDLHIPVIKDNRGMTIDSTGAAFQVMENLVVKKTQYDILNSYTNNIRKGMEMNVVMKGKQKLNDSEGQIE